MSDTDCNILKYLNEIKEFMKKNYDKCKNVLRWKRTKNNYDYIECDDVILVKVDINGFKRIDMWDKTNYGFILMDKCDIDIIENHNPFIHFIIDARHVQSYVNVKVRKRYRIITDLFAHKYPFKDKLSIRYTYRNGNPLDIRKDNLEETANKRLSRRNKSGAVGVSLSNNAWRAHIIINGTPSFKSFSCVKYGKDAKKMAIKCRKKMEEKRKLAKERK